MGVPVISFGGFGQTEYLHPLLYPPPPCSLDSANLSGNSSECRGDDSGCCCEVNNRSHPSYNASLPFLFQQELAYYNCLLRQKQQHQQHQRRLYNSIVVTEASAAALGGAVALLLRDTEEETGRSFSDGNPTSNTTSNTLRRFLGENARETVRNSFRAARNGASMCEVYQVLY